MSRPRWTATLLIAALLAPGVAAAGQRAESTIYVSGVAGAQAQSVTIDVAGLESYEGSGSVALFGADAGFSLPGGVFADAHYFRHSNEFVSELAGSNYDARVDLAGNEWGASLEWQLDLVPRSPLKPFLGVGGSWSRLTLDGKLDLRGESAALESEIDLWRAYGVAGLKLSRYFRATVQGGMTFPVHEGLTTSYTVGGETVALTPDYGGYYVAGSLSVGF